MPGDGRSGHLGADSATELREITAPGPVRSILVDHALRGLRIQVLLRVILAAFVAAVVAFDPPAGYLTATWIVTGAYLAWSALTVVLAVRGDETTVRLLWLAAFGDLVALTAVAILASRSDEISWTSDVLLTGFLHVREEVERFGTDVIPRVRELEAQYAGAPVRELLA